MLMFKKEKEVVKLVLEHIQKSAMCVQETTNSLKSYVAGDVNDALELHENIYALESEADTLLREIRELLYKGAYLPTIRGDIYRLMSTVDRVSNNAEGCFEFFCTQHPEIPEEYQAEFIQALDLTAECFLAFQKALETFFGPKNKFDEVQEYSREVGKLESKVDEVERSLTARIFSSPLHKSEKIHLSQTLRRIAGISDATENSVDQLELISLKSIV